MGKLIARLVIFALFVKLVLFGAGYVWAISCGGGTCPDGWSYGGDSNAPQATCEQRHNEACASHQGSTPQPTTQPTSAPVSSGCPAGVAACGSVGSTKTETISSGSACGSYGCVAYSSSCNVWQLQSTSAGACGAAAAPTAQPTVVVTTAPTVTQAPSTSGYLCDNFAPVGSTHRNAGNGCSYTCQDGGWGPAFACDGQGNGLFQGTAAQTEAERAAQAAAVAQRQAEAAAILATQTAAETAALAAQRAAQIANETATQIAMAQDQGNQAAIERQQQIAAQANATLEAQAAAAASQLTAASGASASNTNISAAAEAAMNAAMSRNVNGVVQNGCNINLGLCPMIDPKTGQTMGWVPASRPIYGSFEQAMQARQNLSIGDLYVDKVTLVNGQTVNQVYDFNWQAKTAEELGGVITDAAEIARIKSIAEQNKIKADAAGVVQTNSLGDIYLAAGGQLSADVYVQKRAAFDADQAAKTQVIVASLVDSKGVLTAGVQDKIDQCANNSGCNVDTLKKEIGGLDLLAPATVAQIESMVTNTFVETKKEVEAKKMAEEQARSTVSSGGSSNSVMNSADKGEKDNPVDPKQAEAMKKVEAFASAQNLDQLAAAACAGIMNPDRQDDCIKSELTKMSGDVAKSSLLAGFDPASTKNLVEQKKIEVANYPRVQKAVDAFQGIKAEDITNLDSLVVAKIAASKKCTNVYGAGQSCTSLSREQAIAAVVADEQNMALMKTCQEVGGANCTSGMAAKKSLLIVANPDLLKDNQKLDQLATSLNLGVDVATQLIADEKLARNEGVDAAKQGFTDFVGNVGTIFGNAGTMIVNTVTGSKTELKSLNDVFSTDKQVIASNTYQSVYDTLVKNTGGSFYSAEEVARMEMEKKLSNLGQQVLADNAARVANGQTTWKQVQDNYNAAIQAQGIAGLAVAGWNDLTTGRFKRGNDLLNEGLTSGNAGKYIAGALTQGGDAAFAVTAVVSGGTALTAALVPAAVGVTAAQAITVGALGVGATTQQIGQTADVCSQAVENTALRGQCVTTAALAAVQGFGTATMVLRGAAQAANVVKVADEAIAAGSTVARPSVGALTEALGSAYNTSKKFQDVMNTAQGVMDGAGALVFSNMAVQSCAESADLNCFAQVTMAAASVGRLADGLANGAYKTTAAGTTPANAVPAGGNRALTAVGTASSLSFAASSCLNMAADMNFDTASICAQSLQGPVEMVTAAGHAKATAASTTPEEAIARVNTTTAEVAEALDGSAQARVVNDFGENMAIVRQNQAELKLAEQRAADVAAQNEAVRKAAETEAARVARNEQLGGFGGVDTIAEILKLDPAAQTSGKSLAELTTQLNELKAKAPVVEEIKQVEQRPVEDPIAAGKAREEQILAEQKALADEVAAKQQQIQDSMAKRLDDSLAITRQEREAMRLAESKLQSEVAAAKTKLEQTVAQVYLDPVVEAGRQADLKAQLEDTAAKIKATEHEIARNAEIIVDARLEGDEQAVRAEELQSTLDALKAKETDLLTKSTMHPVELKILELQRAREPIAAEVTKLAAKYDNFIKDAPTKLGELNGQRVDLETTVAQLNKQVADMAGKKGVVELRRQLAEAQKTLESTKAEIARTESNLKAVRENRAVDKTLVEAEARLKATDADLAQLTKLPVQEVGVADSVKPVELPKAVEPVAKAGVVESVVKVIADAIAGKPAEVAPKTAEPLVPVAEAPAADLGRVIADTVNRIQDAVGLPESARVNSPVEAEAVGLMIQATSDIRFLKVYEVKIAEIEVGHARGEKYDPKQIQSIMDGYNELRGRLEAVAANENVRGMIAQTLGVEVSTLANLDLAGLVEYSNTARRLIDGNYRAVVDGGEIKIMNRNGKVREGALLDFVRAADAGGIAVEGKTLWQIHQEMVSKGISFDFGQKLAETVGSKKVVGVEVVEPVVIAEAVQVDPVGAVVDLVLPPAPETPLEVELPQTLEQKQVALQLGANVDGLGFEASREQIAIKLKELESAYSRLGFANQEVVRGVQAGDVEAVANALRGVTINEGLKEKAMVAMDNLLESLSVGRSDPFVESILKVMNETGLPVQTVVMGDMLRSWGDATAIRDAFVENGKPLSKEAAVRQIAEAMMNGKLGLSYMTYGNNMDAPVITKLAEIVYENKVRPVLETTPADVAGSFLRSVSAVVENIARPTKMAQAELAVLKEVNSLSVATQQLEGRMQIVSVDGLPQVRSQLDQARTALEAKMADPAIRELIAKGLGVEVRVFADLSARELADVANVLRRLGEGKYVAYSAKVDGVDTMWVNNQTPESSPLYKIAEVAKEAGIDVNKRSIGDLYSEIITKGIKFDLYETVRSGMADEYRQTIANGERVNSDLRRRIEGYQRELAVIGLSPDLVKMYEQMMVVDQSQLASNESAMSIAREGLGRLAPEMVGKTVEVTNVRQVVNGAARLAIENPAVAAIEGVQKILSGVGVAIVEVVDGATERLRSLVGGTENIGGSRADIGVLVASDGYINVRGAEVVVVSDRGVKTTTDGDRVGSVIGVSTETFDNGDIGQDAGGFVQTADGKFLLLNSDGASQSFMGDLAARAAVRAVIQSGGSNLVENANLAAEAVRNLDASLPTIANELTGVIPMVKESLQLKAVKYGTEAMFNQLIIDPVTGKVEGLFWGDNGISVIDSEGRIANRVFESNGRITSKDGLKVSRGEGFGSYSTTLGSGDVIMMYSDGFSVQGGDGAMLPDIQNLIINGLRVGESVESINAKISARINSGYRGDDVSIQWYVQK